MPQARGLKRRHALGMLAGAGLASLAPPVGAAGPALAPLRRGINIPDWITPQGLGRGPAPVVLETLRRLGFGVVRLPVAAEPLSEGGMVPAVLGAVEAATAELNARGFAVMLDLHPSAAMVSALEEGDSLAEDAAAEAWARLAPVVAAFDPALVFPELLNEPSMDRDRWLLLRERLATIVRRRCPEHILVWGASRFQSVGETLDMPPLGDGREIAAVHYYTPMGFTHQCESWSGSPLERLRNLPFPATRETPAVRELAAALEARGDGEALALLEVELAEPWTEARVMADFAALGAWSDRSQCAVVLNEFGVLDFCVDPLSRTAWVGAVRRAAESQRLGWAYWELDGGFGLLADRGDVAGFDPGLLDALLAG